MENDEDVMANLKKENSKLRQENECLRKELEAYKRQVLDSEALHSSLMIVQKLLKKLSGPNPQALTSGEQSSVLAKAPLQEFLLSAPADNSSLDMPPLPLHHHLKYGPRSPGVIELTTGSGIYVLTCALDNNKTLLSKCSLFVRSLMENVFTRQALQTCSVRGSDTRGHRGKLEQPREPLYSPAVEAIISASMNFSSEKGWTNKLTDISKYMKQKLCDVRANDKPAAPEGRGK